MGSIALFIADDKRYLSSFLSEPAQTKYNAMDYYEKNIAVINCLQTNFIAKLTKNSDSSA